MKKVFLFLTVLLFAGSLFAQKLSDNPALAAYHDKLVEAESYLENDHAFLAASIYYDLVRDNLGEGITPVFVEFVKLLAAFNNGKPGLKEYDEFDLHDGWKTIQDDYEIYWSNNSPWEFNISKAEKDSLDYETRTANYSIELTKSYSDKYLLFKTVITGGYKTAWQDDWNKTLCRSWPDYNYYLNYNNSVIYNRIPRYYTEKYSEFGLYYIDDNEDCRNIQINCEIVSDETGELVREVQLGCTEEKNLIRGIGKEDVKIIESGKVHIIPRELYYVITIDSYYNEYQFYPIDMASARINSYYDPLPDSVSVIELINHISNRIDEEKNNN